VGRVPREGPLGVGEAADGEDAGADEPERHRQEIPRVLVVFDDEDRLAHEAGVDRGRRCPGVRHVSSAVAKQQIAYKVCAKWYFYGFVTVFLRIRPGATVAERPAAPQDEETFSARVRQTSRARSREETASTTIKAYTSVSTLRKKFSVTRAGWNTAGAATLRAERKPSGSASSAATAVPSSAISSVVIAPSSAAGSTRRSGGSMRRRKSAIQG